MKDFPLLMERRAANKHLAPRAIPWAMIAPHAEQAHLNHSQSLERLAVRGGLSCQEALAILDGLDWDERAYQTDEAAIEELRRRLAPVGA